MAARRFQGRRGHVPLLSSLFISAWLPGALREATRRCAYRQVGTDEQLISQADDEGWLRTGGRVVELDALLRSAA